MTVTKVAFGVTGSEKAMNSKLLTCCEFGTYACIKDHFNLESLISYFAQRLANSDEMITILGVRIKEFVDNLIC